VLDRPRLDLELLELLPGQELPHLALHQDDLAQGLLVLPALQPSADVGLKFIR
jgi:hypothetical protein